MANNTLSFSSDGLKKLNDDEASIDGLYDDPSNYCTFGVGHLVHSTDKWACFLLEAASSDEEWKALVLKRWPGKSYETPYLIRSAAFKDKFQKLKEKAVEKAKVAIAQRKYSKDFAKLSAAEQQSAISAAKAAVDEQARILAKTVDDVLKADLIAFEKAVRDGVNAVELIQDEFDALVSLAFNIGVPSFNSSTLLKEINKNKFRAGNAKERKTAIDSIEKEFLKWNKSGGVVVDGLTARRKKEATRFLAKARQDLAGIEKAKTPGAPAPVGGPAILKKP